MPKNPILDPITDQEMTFAHLVLSGTMTDRSAAETAGLNPDTAAYTKAKSRVRAYMLEHQAAVQQQLVDQETEGLHRLNIGREQVLARLWEIANLSPEMTRNSVTAQVKALAMIVAIEGLIPDRRAVSSEKKSAPLPTADIYESAWLREQRGETTVPQPSSDPVPEKDEPYLPDPLPEAAADTPPPPGTTPNPIPSPILNPNEFAFAHRFGSMETRPSAPRIPVSFERDTREPFSIKKGRFGKR